MIKRILSIVLGFTGAFAIGGTLIYAWFNVMVFITPHIPVIVDVAKFGW